MPGFNHYSHCGCGWCVKFGGGWGRRNFDADAANARVILKERRYKEGSYSSCFVNPNALCPVCRAPVFFYANANGSRVFFDDLGPPWPKHGCTDRGRDYAVRVPTEDHPPLRRRSRGEIAEIFDCLLDAHVDPRDQHRERRSKAPESIFVVEDSVRRGFANHLRAVELVGGQGEIAHFQFTSAKFEPHVGDIFSTDGQTLSFPEQPKRFKVSIINAGSYQAARDIQ